MDECIFCKIIRGEIPSQKLYEDDLAFVMLDAFPGTRGHTLIIPKAHHADVFDTPPELYAHLMKVATKMAESLKQALNYDGVNIFQNTGRASGQTVFHLHIHVFPRWLGDGALGGWNPGNLSDSQFVGLGELIRSHIS